MLGIGLALCAVEGFAQNANHGADGYKLCASCHGFKAEGNQLVNAPALGGLESWYLERQIRNFRDGIRGTAAGDASGQAMAQMMKGLDDEEIADIVAHIATLPQADSDTTITGDIENGRVKYMPCAACHGVRGEGNPALNAPALAGTDDWYQFAQLKKFKDGTRGTVDGDVYGQQMVPMVNALEDDQAMRDVVAYINSLR